MRTHMGMFRSTKDSKQDVDEERVTYNVGRYGEPIGDKSVIAIMSLNIAFVP